MAGSIPETHLLRRLDGAARRHATPCGEGELAWREWGEGEPLVLLHGGFGSWLHWVRNIESLAARRRVIVADLPGLGDSAPPPEPVSPEGVAAPVAAGLEALIPGGAPFDLVGFSFGGLISGQVAKRLGARVRSLTLVGASGLGLPRRRVELVRRTPQMSTRELREAQAFNLRALLLHDPGRVDALAMAVQAHNDERARIKSRRISLGDSLRHALPSFKGRLNGIWGEHDVTATPGCEGQRALLAGLHPDLEFRVLPGAGHWVQFEAAEAFNTTLPEMLSRASR